VGHPTQGELGEEKFNLVGKWRAGTRYWLSRVFNQVPPKAGRWTIMDPACDNIQQNPSAGTRDTVPRALGIWFIPNIPLKIPNRIRWTPKPFAAAKVNHEGSIYTFLASVKAPWLAGKRQWALSSPS
jgi:hypothetical protein